MGERPNLARHDGDRAAGLVLAGDLVRAGAAAWLGLLSLGCGGDGTTEPGSAPARLVAVSPALDTVVAGERADPPVAVRVLDERGEAVEGTPVRFLLLTEGAGRLDRVAVSDRQGIAEADFEAGREPVEARVRVDVPSAGRVAPLEFRLVVRPAASVALAALGGDGQEAELESQLPLPFEVRASTPGGVAAGGVPIAWRVEAEPAGARLTADTAFTDEEGRARSVLTLGRRTGEFVVAAHATGGVASDTVRFRARGLAAASGSVRLDSVRPLPLVAGEEAVVFGAGLAPPAGEIEVRVEGETGSVLEAEAGRIRFRVPAFTDRCLPAREVGLRVLAAGEASNGQRVGLLPLRPPVELAVGEARTLAADELDCLQLPGAPEARAYLAVAQSASRSAGARTAVRLVVHAGDRLEHEQPAAALLARIPAPESRARPGEGPRGELALRERVREEIRARRLVPARRAGPDAGPPAALSAEPAAVPGPGETLEFTFAVGPDFSASCADTTSRIEGVVRVVGDHHLLLTDPREPADGFAQEDWEAIGSEFDRLAFPTDTSYFGAPADLDGNGRIILLFTPEVNALTPRGSGIFIGGFFLALDLADAGGGAGVAFPEAGTCPASNEAEILYMAVPDPEGRFGEPLTAPQARRLIRELLPHELQHLINAERRVLVDGAGFDALEETWLDEGLSHIAEEVSGLELLGLGRGLNLGFDRVTGTRAALDAFNAFHIQNFFNLALFLLDPAGAPTLAAVDPGGLGALQMRGFAWGLLRWLADHEGGADERLLFRSLVDGGGARLAGIANLEGTVGEPWETLLADYLAALALDDEVEAAGPRLRVTTWNLRDVYRALNANPASRRRFPLPFPLALPLLGFESSAVDFDLNASTAQYLSLRSGLEAPPLALELRSRGGGSVSPTAVPQLTIVRTR